MPAKAVNTGHKHYGGKAVFKTVRNAYYYTTKNNTKVYINKDRVRSYGYDTAIEPTAAKKSVSVKGKPAKNHITKSHVQQRPAPPGIHFKVEHKPSKNTNLPNYMVVDIYSTKNNEFMGSASINYNTKTKTSYLNTIAIMGDEYQGKGLGGALWDKSIAELRKLGIKTMKLMAQPTGMSLYNKEFPAKMKALWEWYLKRGAKTLEVHDTNDGYGTRAVDMIYTI